MSKLKFVARFLTVFAVLVALVGFAGIPARYAALTRAVAGIVSPVVNGWWVELRGKEGKQTTWLRRGNEALLFRISLESLALGFIPLLALIGATPLTLKRWALASGLGMLGLFTLHLLVVLVYPFLVDAAPPPDFVVPKNGPLQRIAGQFIGFLAFVGGPVILWFVLTYTQLQTVWQLQGSKLTTR